MPDASLAQQERDVLRRLTSLVAERAKGEAELDEHRERESAKADKACKTAVAAAEAELSRVQAALTGQCRQDQERSRTDWEARLVAARARMETHLRNYNNKTQAIGKIATREHEESGWLAETMVESGQSKIKAEFDLARKQTDKRKAEVEQLRAWATALLQEHRYRPLPEPHGPEEAPAPPATREQLIAAWESARDQAERALFHLKQRVEPPLLTWGVFLLAPALVGAGAWFAVNPHVQWPAPRQAWTIGGAAAGATFILMLVLKLLARRRVPAAAASTAEAFSSASGAIDRAMHFAESERDRQGVELLARRDEEVGQANRRFGAIKREVARRVGVNAPRLRERHSRRLTGLRDKYDAAMAGITSNHEKAMAAAQATRDGKVGEATGARDALMAELNKADHAARTEIERHWKAGIAEVHRDVAAITSAVSAICPRWGEASWDTFVSPDTPPPAVSFGGVAVDMASLPGGLSRDPRMQTAGPTSFTLPSLLDLFDKGSLLLRSDAANAGRSVQVLRDVMLRLLTAFPPGKVRFTIVDPVGLGQNFAGFMHLADYDEALVGGKIWTDPKHIEQRLTDLTEHMETVIQKYLRNEYQTIQEYNIAANEVAEPYRFLIIADFPANMTEASAKRLASIASSGARCGLYTLIAQTTETRGKPSAWLPLAALEQSSAVLAWRDGRFVWQNDDFSAWPLQVEEPPPDEQLTGLLHKVGTASKDASRVQVPFESVAPKPGQLWSLDAASEVRVPLGRAGAKALQYFSLGHGTTQHALIAGRTGSGKSTLLHVLITNLALWYSPDEVEMYLVDFKKGVEFKTYATHSLPHARVVAVESEREFGLSVLRRLDAELTRRGQLFREAGVQDMAGFRKHLAAAGAVGGRNGHSALPRVLLIVDEFQEFFVEDDKLSQEAALLMDRLVRQGRAFGMHVVLGSQTLGGAYSIARSTIGQMAVRIALQCSEADSYIILSEDNAAARLLSRPGEAIYNDVSGRLEGNSLFQIVWLPDEKREGYLETAHDMVQRNGREPPPPPIVFEGNIPADLARNHLLASLFDGAPATGAPRAWLGDAISIKDPTAAAFRRQSGANLLIVGQQEDTAAAMLVSITLSLAAHRTAAPPLVVILDATPADAPQAPLLEGLASRVGARFYRPRDAAAALSEITAELARREAADQHDAPPVFLIVSGLQRIRDLRKEDEFSFSSSGEQEAKSPAQQFARLLREGPPLGVHTIAWCDTATNLERMVDRNSLREFDSRVLFQMSASDSTHLIDVPTASTLGRFRALLHSEETGVIEKFRPYAVPDAGWVQEAAARLATHGSAQPR